MTTGARETPLKKIRPRWFAWLCLFVLVLAVICAGLLVHGVHLVKVKDVNMAIARGLAPDSDKTTVHHFMDAHHILYTGYSQQLRRMYGKIYRASFVGPMKGTILVQFDFDEQGEMKSYRVVEVYDFVWE